MLSNWRRAMLTVGSFVITAATVSAQPQQGKPAEPKVAAANRSVQSRLPFQDKQDFEDATRGFIATAPAPTKADPYAFLDEGAPPTVNPSLWRQAQLNLPSGLFKVTDGVYQIRGFSVSSMTIVE